MGAAGAGAGARRSALLICASCSWLNQVLVRKGTPPWLRLPSTTRPTSFAFWYHGSLSQCCLPTIRTISGQVAALAEAACSHASTPGLPGMSYFSRLSALA
jgi:hypothetical protein